MKSIIISSILSLVITGHNPVSFAYPGNIITTPYGTCTQYYSLGSLNSDGFSGLFNGILFDSDASMTFIHYEFAGQATGQFDVPIYSAILNNTGTSSKYKLFVQGGYLLSTPVLGDNNTEANAMRFQVVDSRSMDILIIHPGWNQTAITVPNLYNQNITLTQTENATINEILNYVSYDSGQIQNIHTDTTMIKNLLISLSGYSADSNDNIATDFDTLITAINSVGADLNIIKQYELSNIILPEQSYAYLIFRNFGTLYDNYNGRFPFYNIDSSVNFQNQFWCNANQDYYLSLRIYNRNQSNLTGLINLVANQYGGSVTKTVIYSDNFNLYSDMTIKYTPSANGYYKITFDSTLNGVAFSPLYFGKALNLSSEMASLTNITTSGITGIINAIKDVSLNVNNLTVNSTGITYNVNNTQVNNSVNTYNTDIQNVYNVENDFSTSFNTYNQQFTPDFTETMTTIQSVPSVMNNVVVDLYNLPFIKYPLLLTLAGIVLIALLGV